MNSTDFGFKSFALKATFVFALSAATVLLIGGVFYATIGMLSSDMQRDQSFSVQGKAKRQVALDSADLRVGVLITAPTAVEAQKQAGEKYNKAIDAIKKLGVKDENIQTQGYSVQPVYKIGTNEIEKYQIDLNLYIKLEDVKPESDMIGNVINAASLEGFNKVNGLNFYLNDYDAVIDELKAEAIEDAKERAERESDLADLRLGEVINVYYNDYYPMYNSRDGVAEMSSIAGSAPMAMEDKAEAMPAVQVNPGSTEVTTNVTIVYEIKN